MRQSAPCPRPPRLATWLVELFASADQAESILGDLHEEFSDIASKSGVITAYSWYWRQSVKTIVHLVGAAFRVGSWSIAGAVLFGFVLRRYSFSMTERVIFAILRAQRPYPNLHYGFYVWLAHAIMGIFVGCIVALAAKGREMVATMTLALVLYALIGAALVHIGLHGPIDFAWLQWSVADASVTVLGGVIVREFRLLLARPHSRA